MKNIRNNYNYDKKIQILNTKNFIIIEFLTYKIEELYMNCCSIVMAHPDILGSSVLQQKIIPLKNKFNQNQNSL